MRPVRRAALAIAAAVPLALSTARAEEPAPAQPKAAAAAAAAATPGRESGTARVAPPADAAKDFFAPKASKASAKARSWSRPAGDDDGDEALEVSRGAGRCGG
jgi:hypothetical protein